MSWSIAPNLLLVAAIVVFLVVIWRRRSAPSLRWPLVLTHVAALCYALGDLGTILADGLGAERMSLAMLYTGGLLIPPLWWSMALRFAAARGAAPAWSERWWTYLPFGFGALVWLGAMTNPLHGHFVTPVVGERSEHHWLWYVATIGSYAIVAGVCAVYLSLVLFRRARPRLRAQSGLLLAATLLPLAANVAYNYAAWPWLVDPTVLGLAGTNVLLVAGIHWGQLFGVSAISLRDVIHSDSSGVLLLDTEGNLLFSNAAAERLTGLELHPGTALLPSLASRLRRPHSEDPVSQSELWGQAYKPGEHGSGSLYRIDRPRPLWLWVSLVRTPSSWWSVSAWCLRLEDVTVLRDAEEERARLERRLRQGARLENLAADAAGIIRGLSEPLETIQAVAKYGRLSGTSTDDDWITADSFDAISREATRCKRMIDDLVRTIGRDPEHGSENEGDA